MARVQQDFLDLVADLQARSSLFFQNLAEFCLTKYVCSSSFLGMLAALYVVLEMSGVSGGVAFRLAGQVGVLDIFHSSWCIFFFMSGVGLAQ